MPTIFTTTSRKVFTLLLATVVVASANAQIKIGDNPTNASRSAILELESTRQGLLLPRLSDTADIDALTPPDGMIIYLNADNSLRLRKGGIWSKLASMADAGANWSLSGNTGTNPALQFLGTLDNKPLIIKTNGTEALRIDASGNLGVGVSSPSARLDVDGTVKLQNMSAGTTELEVLVIGADGSVAKRTMSQSAFENAIKSINGIQAQTLSIAAAASTTNDALAVTNNTADSTITIELPVQDGNSTSKPYGLLTLADWNKIGSAIQTISIGAVASAADAKGATITTSGDTRTIVLHPADATNPGLVSAGAQTFGGDKTFAANVNIGGNLELPAVASNTTGADSVLVMANGVVEKRQVSAAAFGNAIRNINGNRDTAQVMAFGTAGTDLNMSTNGTDSIYFNVPDAGAANRGVVTTAAQTFAGTKTFQDSVTATAAMKVGATGNANATMQVAGSLSLAIKKIFADYTATDADNTILANATSGAIVLTLPTSAAIAGRVYTIKKVGTGGISNSVAITPSSGTIEGGSTLYIYNDWSLVTLQTDGTDWYIIKR